MSVCSKEMVAIRVDLLKQMHKYIIEIGDEYIYESWIISAVPDEPSEADYESIADDDDEWIRICGLFGRLAHEDIKENY